MKKIVIAGSAKLQSDIEYFKEHFENKGYIILDYPQKIDESKFMEIYPNVHKNFFECITKTDILFIMNADKNGTNGYIGAETFAELTFGLAQKLVYNKDIELVILKMPGKEVACYDEISLWLKLGWIKLYEGDYYEFKK